MTNQQQTNNNNSNSNEIIIVVDPSSTGYNVALEIKKRGYNVVALWSKSLREERRAANSAKIFGNIEYLAEVEEGGNLQETKERLDEIKSTGNVAGVVAAVFAGNDAGVPLADALSEYLGLRSNGTLPNGADRRNKYVQQEMVRKAGLPAVQQAIGLSFTDEIRSFLKNQSYPVVVKPNAGSGTDGVKLCYTYEEARDHFNFLLISFTSHYSIIERNEVLCQEFLKGKEYVVDHASRDGIHKTCMVWVYDKGEANGANFVPFAMKPVDPTSVEAIALVEYTRSALDAIQFKNGASHSEIMLTPDGPRLVEINCRTCGISGLWIELEKALTGGYSQVDAMVDAYLNPTAFFAIPDQPAFPFKSSGQIMVLVSYHKGSIQSVQGLEKIKNLSSYVASNTPDFKVGDTFHKTVDLASILGIVTLCHPDARKIQEDVKIIRSMEKHNGFFVNTSEGIEDKNDQEKDNESMLPQSGGQCLRRVSIYLKELERCL